MAIGKMYRDLIQTDYFRVVVVDDVEAVEVCGALKVRSQDELIYHFHIVRKSKAMVFMI